MFNVCQDVGLSIDLHSNRLAQVICPSLLQSNGNQLIEVKSTNSCSMLINPEMIALMLKCTKNIEILKDKGWISTKGCS